MRGRGGKGKEEENGREERIDSHSVDSESIYTHTCTTMGTK